ncbi:transposase family protein [Streptosporangium sp. LJ11]|uniref:transposase family protein n=1 Tax=Streptosporangium sp. LJ11 TaxID=3436927 RepID=UPI003F78D32D
MFAYAAAEGVELRIDGTEVQVRRPAAHRPGRRAFVSGKRKQNTCKSTVISDGDGRLLWQGAFRPGRMHDVTTLCTEGIEDLLRFHPDVKAKVDSGHQGLARDFPTQVTAPPKKPGKDTTPAEVTRREAQRHRQSSQRICVEHAIAEPKQRRSMQRWIGRREHFAPTARAIAGPVPDRCAMR